MEEEELTGRPGNEIVKGQDVRLDFGHFEKKSFIGCNLVYAGGHPPTLIECDFIGSRFAFEGPALHTVQFMSHIAKGGEGGRDLINQMLGIK